MQLISLTANKPTFKSVNFTNTVGLNFIVATQKHPESADNKHSSTLNGVGKSLIVTLIHFCLGSSKKESFKQSLPGWIFTLKFKVGEKIYESVRSTDKQEIITLDGEETSLAKFNKKLGSLLFEIPAGMSELSFRSLLSFFIRPRKASYIDFNNPNAVKKDYQIQITNALLLGLDVQKVEDKFKLRKEKERISNLINEITRDDLLKDFFNNKKDPSLESQQLKEDIEKLENDLEKFVIAEDYYEVNAEADSLKNSLDEIRNKIVLLQNQILNIDKTREISIDIKKESIVKIYREASVIIRSETLKTLSDLEQFYEHLSTNREKRLLDQKVILQKQLEELNKLSTKKNNELDEKLKYLNAKKALDVFVKINDRLSDLRTKMSNILRYDELISSYKQSKIDIEKKNLDSTEKTTLYLKDAKDIINTTQKFFRTLSKRFYPNSVAGISISNNDGDNQIRYNIDAKIEADASDGINNIKIFCYDLTLLLKGFSHKINFIFHDSRLLSDTDPRQVVDLFRILNETISSSNKQYNLTLNQNQLDEVKKHLTEDEYKTIILDNICLELKDETAADKLLGIQINMEYS